jgi:hypothetical protein
LHQFGVIGFCERRIGGGDGQRPVKAGELQYPPVVFYILP